MKKYILLFSSLFLFACEPMQEQVMVDCENPNYTQSYSIEDKLNFCYKEEWEKPSITSIEAETGEAFRVKFTNAKVPTPELVFQTQDFKTSNPNSISFCFECFDINLSEEDILGQLAIIFFDSEGRYQLDSKKTTVEKVKISNKDAIKVDLHLLIKNQDDPKNSTEVHSLIYYAPSAFGNGEYHLSISTIPDIEDVLDQFLETIELK